MVQAKPQMVGDWENERPFKHIHHKSFIYLLCSFKISYFIIEIK